MMYIKGCSVAAVVRFLFFFSSRRRHTRFDCDWSSDVCSSDLLHVEDVAAVRGELLQAEAQLARLVPVARRADAADVQRTVRPGHDTVGAGLEAEIGRASCRERVEVSAGAGSLEEKDGDEHRRS